MTDLLDFYIDGAWVRPDSQVIEAVIDPSSEQVVARIILGNERDVNRAVAAAEAAFASFSATAPEQRIELLERIIDGYQRRSEALALAVHQEMGAPLSLARTAHVPAGLGHLVRALEVLKHYPFETMLGSSRVMREPIWRVWPDHSLELAAQPAHLQSRPGAGRRLHGGAQAQ